MVIVENIFINHGLEILRKVSEFIIRFKKTENMPRKFLELYLTVDELIYSHEINEQKFFSKPQPGQPPISSKKSLSQTLASRFKYVVNEPDRNIIASLSSNYRSSARERLIESARASVGLKSFGKSKIKGKDKKRTSSNILFAFHIQIQSSKDLNKRLPSIDPSLMSRTVHPEVIKEIKNLPSPMKSYEDPMKNFRLPMDKSENPRKSLDFNGAVSSNQNEAFYSMRKEVQSIDPYNLNYMVPIVTVNDGLKENIDDLFGDKKAVSMPKMQNNQVSKKKTFKEANLIDDLPTSKGGVTGNPNQKSIISSFDYQDQGDLLDFTMSNSQSISDFEEVSRTQKGIEATRHFRKEPGSDSLGEVSFISGISQKESFTLDPRKERSSVPFNESAFTRSAEMIPVSGAIREKIILVVGSQRDVIEFKVMGQVALKNKMKDREISSVLVDLKGKEWERHNSLQKRLTPGGPTIVPISNLSLEYTPFILQCLQKPKRDTMSSFWR